MVAFAHKEFSPGDAEGFGLWRLEHAYAHEQFVRLARGLQRPATVPEYDLWSWHDDPALVRRWLLAHYEIHLVLREIAGIRGSDLSVADWDNPLEILVWIENHAREHQDLERAFGIT
jgi:hypothetical protein